MDTTAPRMPTEDRTLVGLFSDLWRETTRLIHAEAELAKARAAYEKALALEHLKNGEMFEQAEVLYKELTKECELLQKELGRL